MLPKKEGRMILLGCLLAFGASVAPRLFLILAWIFSDRWPRVWGNDFILPLLGIIFLPYTTIMYMLVWTPTGINGWDWLWIILGLFLDFWKWTQVWANRQKGMEMASGYYAPGGSSSTGGGSSAAMSSSSTTSTPAPTSSTLPSSTPPASMPPASSSGTVASEDESPPA
jgi:hypothetical protein